ncbi:hypothetical protein T4D_5335 [Trichinella pseudospiralis]|uniref:Uncharacterized protein n=1 Tax=Trichinella pseudospiralis TaxID=6337 RepID=A0A0V1F8K2_TRIPS|nr:hypothetical protein T4D_5335 [Trichinella pseudospiralis]
MAQFPKTFAGCCRQIFLLWSRRPRHVKAVESPFIRNNPTETRLQSHSSSGRSSNPSSHVFVIIIDADQDIDHWRRPLPLSFLRVSLRRGSVSVLIWQWLDFTTNPGDHKRLYLRACLWSV